MTLIIVISTIVFFIAGYYLMDRIDRFLDSNFIKLEENNYISNRKDNYMSNNYVLIFGHNELTTYIEGYCKEKNKSYKLITNVNDLDFNFNYSFLFALSNNDLDNLILCSICKNICNVPIIVPACNERENIRIYNDFYSGQVLIMDNDINYSMGMIKELMDLGI